MSVTLTVTKPGSYDRVTTARAASACRTVLVSASWMIRYAVRSTLGASVPGVPSTARSTASPDPRTWSSTVPRSARDIAGAVSSWSAGPRSTPSRRRSSVRAWRAVAAITSTDWAAWAGRPGSSDVAASACTAMRLTWCATTSCSSRAIRVRSAAAARATSLSRSDSARSARLSASWTLACRFRTTTAAPQAPRVVRADTTASYGWVWPGDTWDSMLPITTRRMTTRRTAGRQ